MSGMRGDADWARLAFPNPVPIRCQGEMRMTMLRQCARVCLVVVAAVLLCAGHAVADGISPFKADPRFSRALGLLAKGDLAGADRLFAEVAQSGASGTQAQASLARAQVAIAQSRLADAERAVAAVLAKDPDRPEAHNMRGVVLLAQNKSAEARAAFDRAIALRPKYITPYVYLATLARASGNFEAAATAYQALVNVAPALPAGHIGLAEAYFMLKRDQAGFKVLESWKASAKTSPMPARLLADVHLARGEQRQALEELTSAVKTFPNDAGTRLALGDALAASGDAAAAIAQYESVLNTDPGSVDASVRLGVAKLHAGDTKQAVASFRTALRIAPRHAVAANNLGWALAESGGNLDEALKYRADGMQGRSGLRGCTRYARMDLLPPR